MKKVVVIGGGTGSYMVLRGLKKYPLDITAVVSAFDSGGSSGILRDEFGVLPPGDVRRCLVALSDEKKENMLRDLFGFRFKKESSLQGHNLGNLLLTALSEIKGGEVAAIQTAGELLDIKGRVFPVSKTRAQLCARLMNGRKIIGEKNIDVPKHNGNLKIERVYLKPRATLLKEAREAMAEADVVVIGPGDLYTSLIPNFLVGGMRRVCQKSNATFVYILNVMTKWGETNNFSASDFPREILRYLGRPTFDYILANNKRLKPSLLAKYRKEKSMPVVIDEHLSLYTKRIIQAPLIHQSDIIRHESDALARILSTII